MESYLKIVTLLVIALICLSVCFDDIYHRTIKNSKVIVILSLALVYCAVNQSISLVPALISFIVGYALFHLRVMGAGDVKLFCCLSLMIPANLFFSFLFMTTVFGVAIVFFGLIFYREKIKKFGVPYGVAISLSYFFHLILL